MSYSKSSSEKFTLIDDLLDLDDPKEQITNNNNYKDILPNGQEDKYAKFIRQQHKSKYEEHESNSNSNNIQGYSQQGNGYSQGYSQQGNGYSHNMNGYDNDHIKESYINNQNPYSIPTNSPYSCLDIAGHIENCPICSKFYNNDKSVYIIAIVILVIMCIILLKKVLDK
jgi:hypothetical protein